ncbi:MAG: ABC transporter ATP-binding protein [Oscillospiraceae bacterium]|jgi:putative ABC transport system ATP-binding protein|nr:ABC transporter ATP-binding protein [Oscillospiraceae bacterium]
MQTILKVRDLEKVYGGRGNVTHALRGISFDVRQGEYVGVMGASGSGKTTLLNCVSTIDTATAGTILIEGADVTKLKGGELAHFRCHKLGFIFQDYNLLDTMTAFENIALALTIAKYPAKKTEQRVREVAAQLSIEDILDKYPIQMSGGQRQRIASARAIVTNPALVLADEPTGALDSKSARALLESFRAMVAELQSTILVVTHDPFSASYCDRILFMRDGKLFTELVRGTDNRKAFFDKIIEVVAVLGGEAA